MTLHTKAKAISFKTILVGAITALALFTFAHTAQADQPEVISISAYGKSGEERLQLNLDGESVVEWTMSTTSEMYSYQPDTAGDKNIQVEFVNDNGTERNAYVDYLEIAGPHGNSDRYQAEDQPTNTAVYKDGSCGGGYDEAMQCDGYIGFGTKTVEMVSNDAPIAEDDPQQDSDPTEYCASTGTASVVDVMANDSDPDGDLIEINNYTQPSNGTVSLDDRGTATTTDDRLSYYPSATGTDSFTYQVNDIDTVNGYTFSTTSETATVRFNTTEDDCEKDANISLSADPGDMPAKDDYGTTTLSWSYDGVNNCETQDGTSEWRNIDPLASADCESVEDGSCAGSDSTEIYDLENDTTFTLACDTAQDGDSTIDTSSSTDVTVTDKTACPFVEGSGDDEFDHVISINEEVRGDTSPLATSEYSQDLTAGTYEVALWDYDDARGEDYSRSAQNQEYEKWFVQFENSDESYELNSSSTDDLPDDTQLGTSTLYTTVDLAENVSKLKGAHHAVKVGQYDPKAHSLIASCVAIDSDFSEPDTSISATPDTIDYGASTTLDWTFSSVSTGTTSSDTGNSQWANTDAVPSGLSCDPNCTGSSSKTISDLTQDTTFNLDFQDAYGKTASSSVWVDVDDKPVSISADLNQVEPDASTTLSWEADGMDSCEASSDPTNSQWDSDTNPSVGSGSATITDMSSTTDFTITCEDTSEGDTFTDTVQVEVVDFWVTTEPKEVWGVQLPGSVTTQSNVYVTSTDNFNGTVKLSAEFIEGDIGADLQFVDDNGNVISNDKTTLNKFEYEDGYWLQAQLGSNVTPGETSVRVTATNKNSSSSDSETIEMHVRSIGEL